MAGSVSFLIEKEFLPVPQEKLFELGEAHVTLERSINLRRIRQREATSDVRPPLSHLIYGKRATNCTRGQRNIALRSFHTKLNNNNFSCISNILIWSLMRFSMANRLSEPSNL